MTPLLKSSDTFFLVSGLLTKDFNCAITFSAKFRKPCFHSACWQGDPFCFPDGSLRGQPNDVWILVSAHPSQDTKGEDGVQRRSQGVERSQNRQEMWGPEAKRPTEVGITLQSPSPPAKTVSNHVLINRRKDIKNRTPSTKCLLLDVVQKKARNLLSINCTYFVKILYGWYFCMVVIVKQS